MYAKIILQQPIVEPNTVPVIYYLLFGDGLQFSRRNVHIDIMTQIIDFLTPIFSCKDSEKKKIIQYPHSFFDPKLINF